MLFITAVMALAACVRTVGAWHSLRNLAAYMPNSTLPIPTGLELKYVLLGVGTQNYTCTTANVTSEPGTTGALGTSSSAADQTPLISIQPGFTTLGRSWGKTLGRKRK